MKKELNNNYIKLTFPEFDTLIAKIKEKPLKPNIEQYECSQVYTILGGRGSGKSTVLKVIKEELSRFPSVITLNIIGPEDLHECSDFLGWIIRMLDKKARERIEHLKKDNFYSPCEIRPPSPEKLYEYYWLLKKLDNKKYIYDLSKKELIRQQNEILQADLCLKEAFEKYLDEYIEFIKRIENCKSDENLVKIICFFDDVDIYSGRTFEILETVRLYLGNRAFFITIVTGEESVLQQAVTLKLLEREQILQEALAERGGIDFKDSIFEEGLLISRHNRSYEYLKKVLPFSNRFNMRQVTNKYKGDYKDLSTNRTLKEQLMNIAIKIRQVPNENKELNMESIITERLIELAPNRRSGLNVEETLQAKEFPTWMYSLLDSNARSLTNLHSILRSINERNKSGSVSPEDTFLNYKALLTGLLRMNSALAKNSTYQKQLILLIEDISRTDKDVIVKIDAFINEEGVFKLSSESVFITLAILYLLSLSLEDEDTVYGINNLVKQAIELLYKKEALSITYKLLANGEVVPRIDIKILLATYYELIHRPSSSKQYYEILFQQINRKTFVEKLEYLYEHDLSWTIKFLTAIKAKYNLNVVFDSYQVDEVRNNVNHSYFNPPDFIENNLYKFEGKYKK